MHLGGGLFRLPPPRCSLPGMAFRGIGFACGDGPSPPPGSCTSAVSSAPGVMRGRQDGGCALVVLGPDPDVPALYQPHRARLAVHDP